MFKPELIKGEKNMLWLLALNHPPVSTANFNDIKCAAVNKAGTQTSHKHLDLATKDEFLHGNVLQPGNVNNSH